LLSFQELTEEERTSLWAVVEDLPALVTFIERHRLKKEAPPQGIPPDKVGPLDSLLDVLERMRSRLHHLFFEAPHADE
jgi:hypothetical protein